jgi:hypothetical protein
MKNLTNSGRRKVGQDQFLDEESSGDELQKEAEWIERNCVNHHNRCCKKIRVCARSKRW